MSWIELHQLDFPSTNPHGISELFLSRSQMKVCPPVPRHEGGGQPLRRIGGDDGQIPNLLYRYLSGHAHTSHRVFPVARPEHAGCAPESSA